MASKPGAHPLSPYQLQHIHESQGPRVIGISGTLIGIAVVVVAARFYARRVRKLPLKADDFFMIPALLSSVGVCICNIIAAKHGFGKHIWAVGPVDFVPMLKCLWASNIVYVLAHFCTKISILLLYRRVFTTIDRTFKIALWCVMVFVTVWAIAVLFLGIFACAPVARVWNRTLKGSCISSVAAQAIPNFLSVAADIIILLLPGIILFRLHLTVGRKIGLMALFCVGVFTCGAGLARAALAFSPPPDVTYHLTEIFIWSAVETTIGIVCGCFPVIAPAFSGDFFKKSTGTSSLGRWIQKVFGSTGSSSRNPDVPRPNMQLNHWPSTRQITIISNRDTRSGSDSSTVVSPGYSVVQLPNEALPRGKGDEEQGFPNGTVSHGVA